MQPSTDASPVLAVSTPINFQLAVTGSVRLEVSI
jgi:hypothetical protein